ncbi:MAG: methyl-accepting chemotaxis protein, partial [Caulobacteraceae bacterium]|nr:methyl-accepting chemotaxis protein [Caulobacteraceae bacterium]
MKISRKLTVAFALTILTSFGAFAATWTTLNNIDTAHLAIELGAGLNLVFALGICWMLKRSIARPASEMSSALTRMAAGESSVEAPGARRQDELGEIARAVVAIRQASAEKAHMEALAAEFNAVAEKQPEREDAASAMTSQEHVRVVERLGEGLDKLSAGDLTFTIDQPFAAEYEKLRTDFNAAMARLQQLMAAVIANTGAIQNGSDEIAQASDDLSRRTEQQAASLEETAAALDQITATVKKTATGAQHASDAVAAAKSDATHSGEVVSKAVEAMGQIETSAKQISQIIGVIDEIAFQTNLLALNAGVEAARAGDAGRGFAVVAQEVRALAQRSADAAKEIKALISASSQQVGQGVSLVNETGDALRSIVGKVSEIDGLVHEITASAREQATGLGEVNSAVNQMDQVVQQNAAMVEESTAAAHSLRSETAELSRLISQFKVGGAQRVERRPSAAPAARSASAPRASAPAPATRASAPAPSPARAMTQKIAASFAAAAPVQDEW